MVGLRESTAGHYPDDGEADRHDNGQYVLFRLSDIARLQGVDNQRQRIRCCPDARHHRSEPVLGKGIQDESENGSGRTASPFGPPEVFRHPVQMAIDESG